MLGQGSAILGQEVHGALPKSVRKIRPSQPVHAITTIIPPALETSVTDAKEKELNKLERAFIDLYSESGKVGHVF
jgi:hypothetical protein